MVSLTFTAFQAFLEFFLFLVLCTQVKIYVCDVVSECVHTGQAEKFGIEPATFGLSNSLPTELRGQVGSNG